MFKDNKMATKTRKQRLAKKFKLFPVLSKNERKELGKKVDLCFKGKIKRKDLPL